MAQININSFTGSGCLGRDSEFRTFGSEGKELSFSIANNRGFGNYEHCNWINCKLFGKRAESLQQYMKKGTSVIVSGELAIKPYEKDGAKRLDVHIVCSEIQLLGGNDKPSGEYKPKQETKSNPFASTDSHDSVDKDFEDDIPF